MSELQRAFDALTMSVMMHPNGPTEVVYETATACACASAAPTVLVVATVRFSRTSQVNPTLYRDPLDHLSPHLVLMETRCATSMCAFLESSRFPERKRTLTSKYVRDARDRMFR